MKEDTDGLEESVSMHHFAGGSEAEGMRKTR